MSSSDIVQQRLHRGQTRGFLIGALGLALCIIFGVRNPEQFFRSYVFAFLFWSAVPLGCLGILLLHTLTSGWWGYPIRRIVEAGTRTLPFVFVLFLPVLFGMKDLYPWAQPDMVASDPILQYKQPYLNPTFFTVRAIIYFAIWIFIGAMLNKWAAEQDRTGDPALLKRMTTLSAPGMVVFVVVLSLAVIDWVMSLEPHWFSTIYGFVFLVTDGLAGISFAIMVCRNLSDQEPLKDCVPPNRFIDMGNMMLAMVLLWAYLSFSQLLIIWSGNLKNEIPWYRQRVFGAWAPIAVILIVFHFFVPFFLLLQRRLKRRLHVLSRIAALVFLIVIVDLFWIVVPAFQPDSVRVHALDILALVGLGGVWLGAFFWQLKKRPLLPLHDPRFEGALEHAHGD